MKVTIEIDDVEHLEPFKAEALAALLGRLPKVEAVEPAKKEARKPRAKAKPDKAEAEQPKHEIEPSKPEAEMPKHEDEPSKPEAEKSVAEPYARAEFASEVCKYCRHHPETGEGEVAALLKELGIEELDEITPEQINTARERLGL